jgi:hypothetical protein
MRLPYLARWFCASVFHVGFPAAAAGQLPSIRTAETTPSASITCCQYCWCFGSSVQKAGTTSRSGVSPEATSP